MRQFIVLGLLLVAGALAAPDCSKPLFIDTHVGDSQQGNIKAEDISEAKNCEFLTFGTVSGPDNRLTVNIRGAYTYIAPSDKQASDMYTLNITCMRDTVCTLRVYATAAAVVTLAPKAPATASPPVQVQTPVPQANCPKNVYTYSAELGRVMSGSLNDQKGEAPCIGPRSFALENSPNLLGKIDEFSLFGSFRYTPPTGGETWDEFDFTVKCNNIMLCQHTAYIKVTKPTDGGDVPQPPTGPSAQPVATPTPSAVTPEAKYVNTKYQSCKGSCIADAWKAVPNAELWDVSANVNADHPHVTPRSDGRTIGDMEASWNQGTLTLKHFGKIGNVAQRFPTFEPISWASGNTLSSIDVENQAADSSLAFDAKCLDKQNSWGMAEEIWKWTSIPNRTGTVGRRYKAGTSWYQKFAGAHDGCDTFVESCRNAPLLTPVTKQSAGTGEWSVDIDGCDATWTGQFTFDAMRNMKRRDGSSVWKMSEGHLLETTIFSEAVQPADWINPEKGYKANTVAQKLKMDLEPWLTVEQSSKKDFSVDVEYFEYVDEKTKDASFGLNILFYPHVPAGAKSSFKTDRHVSGFRWIGQDWTNPDPLQCPQCTGTDVKCAVAALGEDKTFWSDKMPVGDCTNPRVLLQKGPQMPSGLCPPNRMHITDRNGFSAPTNCRTSFQNITIRGSAPGSGRANKTAASFGFEGKLTLELLLDNMARPTVEIDLSLFIAMITDDSPYTVSSDVCRSAPYWPVYDPLGKSTPSNPHPLSDSKPGLLCVDRLDRTYGPTGWALVSYDVASVSASRVAVESVVAQFNGNTVYFENRDANGNTVRAIPGNAVWWDELFPYFNYREATKHVRNASAYALNYAPMSKLDFAFLFTPGTIELETDLLVVTVLRVLDADGKVESRLTARRKIRIDPTLTELSRFGPNVASLHRTAESSEKHSLLAMVATVALLGGLFVIVLFFFGSQPQKPLPGWLPRSDQMTKLMNPASMKKPLPKPKKATENGIPVAQAV